jgi:pyruvate kinase
VRRAKIVGTLGPSSNTVEKIEALIQVGLNVARVNMSHGTHEGHSVVIKSIREASKRCGYEVAILMDLQGPKIRVDKLEAPLILENNSQWYIGTRTAIAKLGHKNSIPTVYENLVTDLKDDARVLFDDGLIIGRSVKREGDCYLLNIEVGGELKSNKGINLPDINVSAPSLTEKDEKDLEFGLREGVDYVALSFVRTADDVLEVQAKLHQWKINLPIVAKIERPEAIINIDSIIKVADVIMVARGDMGVELGNHLVPSVQKEIIRKCNTAGVPVITATQMLESMITNPTPTRAEASDVANAIWDGTDAVMLSGETASGKYPIEAIKMMGMIIKEAEKKPKERPLLRNQDLSSVNVATMVAASLIAEKVKARRILAVTQTGSSCRKISRFRPVTQVMGITNDLRVMRRMCLYWGVSPFYFPIKDNVEVLESEVIHKIRTDLKLNNGDKLVITRGDGKLFAKSQANSVRVEVIKDAPKVVGGSDTLESATFSRGQINLDTHACASCQSCISICPFDIWAINPENQSATTINQANVEKCRLDMACVEVCPTGAIEIITKNG